MAEVNAFSIDGTRYQLTATDQTYVGETGLAQLGLDSTCTPDEAAQALMEAGGGTLLLSGYDDIDPDTWDTADWYGGGYGLLRLSDSGTPGGAGTFCRTVLEFEGCNTKYGRRVKYPVYSSSTGYTFEGADWCVLVYGAGDTWTAGRAFTVGGRFNSGGDGDVQMTIGHIAPGVSSATCSAAGTCYVYDVDGDYKTITSASKHTLKVGNGFVQDTIDCDTTFSGRGHEVCGAEIGSGFTIKFS